MRKFIVLLAVPLLLVGCRSNPQDVAVRPVYREPDQVMDAPPSPNAATRIAAAQLAESQGRLDVAVEQYREAVRTDADNRQALFGLARIFTATRNYEQAISAWERYVKATKENPTAWTNLARCHEMAGNWKEAEASYLRALQRDPTHKQARVNYGLLLARRDRVDEAEDQLTKVLKPAEVQYNIASIYEITGEFDLARQRYAQASQIDPNFKAPKQRLELLDQRVPEVTRAD